MQTAVNQTIQKLFTTCTLQPLTAAVGLSLTIVNQFTYRAKLEHSHTGFLTPITGKKELFCSLQYTVSARTAWLDKTFIPLRQFQN